MYFKRLQGNNNQKVAKDIVHVSESFRNIRANMTFAMAKSKNLKTKIIMFTSAEQGDGKSTTCLNLADAYADSNAKVLIIDADLRRPQLAKELGVGKRVAGLSDYLGGFCSLEEIVVRPEQCAFDCIFAGRTPPNPSELLMLDEVEELLKTLSEKYDYIFIDTPPVGVVSETIYLTQFVTGVIVVVKKNETHRKILDSAISLLQFAEADILGFVINNAYEINDKKDYYKRNKYYYYK